MLSTASPVGIVPAAPSGMEGRRRPAVMSYGFVAVFALLLASFPARNPDVWEYLASGRNVAHGRFAGPAGGLSSTWLFDLAAYAAYSVGGETGVVGVKAILICGLAVLLLRLSRTGPGWWIPGVCVGLAVLTLSIRVLVQPGTVSYVFLGLALWFLRPRGDRPPPASLLPWPLAVLFLVWANTDSGFVVGLGVVTAVLAGRLLDGAAGGRRAAGRAALTVAVIAAVCLLNPEGPRAFRQLAQAWSRGAGAAGLRAVGSPFERGYLDFVAETPAGLAYFALLGLSLASFALTVRAWRWECFLPWAGLAGLSACQVRAVPYFAVVAGPVLAWNLQTFFGRATGAAPAGRSRSRRLLAGALAGLFGLAFLAAAWPGWLQGPPFEPRRWVIETPPALRVGAEAVCEWQSAGRLGPAAAGLHLSPDTAAAFAWFCPDDRVVRDPDLLAEAVGSRPARPGWADRMRAAGVTHLVVYDTDRQRRAGALGRLLADPEQWPLLILEGGVAVFGWRDPARTGSPDPFGESGPDLDRRALRPSPAETAPAVGPTDRRWWEAFWKPARVPTADRDAAITYLVQAEALRRSALPRHVSAWEATELAGLIGSAAGWAGPTALVDADQRLAFFTPPAGPDSPPGPLERLANGGAQRFFREREDSPAAVLYLAVRAARRAAAADPRDAQAYLALGEAYMRLIHTSRERVWGRTLAELVQLRRAQAAAALERALALDPDAAEPHLHLGALYQDLGFLDLALDHKRAYLAQVRKSTGALPDDIRAAARAEQDHLDTLARELDDRRRDLEAVAPNLRVLDRAVRARDLGLAGRARDILLASDISAFGPAGLAQELELLVATGRPREVLSWTAPEHEAALGAQFHWLRAQAFAAVGDYALAEEECARLGTDPGDPLSAGPRAALASVLGQYAMDGQQAVPHLGQAAWLAFGGKAFRARFVQLVAILRRQADARVLRGLLALEAGEVEAAAADFRAALTTWGGPAAVADGSGIDFEGRPLAAGALAWIESAGR